MFRIEEWRDIKGYEGLYQVSNLGRVKSLERVYFHGNRMYSQKERILKQNVGTNGYMSVMLYNSGHESKRIMIHILVANAFIYNPYNLPQINHKDENKANNCITNLEWCTCKYNNNYGTKRIRLSKSMKGKVQPKELNVRRSITMKKHIAMRKEEGIYWFGKN